MAVEKEKRTQTLSDYLGACEEYTFLGQPLHESAHEDSVVPEFERFRLKLMKGCFGESEYHNLNPENSTEYNELVGRIEDFYEREIGGEKMQKLNGAITVRIPSGIVSVVTTPFKDEALVSATYIKLDK